MPECVEAIPEWRSAAINLSRDIFLLLKTNLHRVNGRKFQIYVRS